MCEFFLCVSWCSFSAVSELEYDEDNIKRHILLQGDFNDAMQDFFCFVFVVRLEEVSNYWM